MTGTGERASQAFGSCFNVEANVEVDFSAPEEEQDINTERTWVMAIATAIPAPRLIDVCDGCQATVSALREG